MFSRGVISALDKQHVTEGNMNKTRAIPNKKY